MQQNPWQMVQVKMHEEDLRRLSLLATKDKTSTGYQIRFAVQEYLAQRKQDLEKTKKTSSKKVLSFRSKR
jgi:hypothetical protein